MLSVNRLLTYQLNAYEFHLETFGTDVLEEDLAILEVFIAEMGIHL